MPHRCRSPIKNDNQGASNTDGMRENDANWSERCTALAEKGALCRRAPCDLCLVPCSACCTLKRSKQNGHEELTTCKLAQKKLRFLAQTCAACQKRNLCSGSAVNAARKVRRHRRSGIGHIIINCKQAHTNAGLTRRRSGVRHHKEAERRVASE